MMAEDIGARATFNVKGGYRVYQEDGKWYVSVSAAGRTDASDFGNVRFHGTTSLVVDGKVVQQQSL